jgi:DNA-binding NarL/FixJ family response regulator
MSLRVFLVDDHGLFRAGVRSEIGHAVDVVGEAASVEEAVPAILAASPDVVVVDVHLPGGGGKAIIEAVQRQQPDITFLALSVSDSAEDVVAIIRAGARGYVTKTIDAGELVDAITRVRAGDAVFSRLHLQGGGGQALPVGEDDRDPCLVRVAQAAAVEPP